MVVEGGVLYWPFPGRSRKLGKIKLDSRNVAITSGGHGGNQIRIYFQGNLIHTMRYMVFSFNPIQMSPPLGYFYDL